MEGVPMTKVQMYRMDTHGLTETGQRSLRVTYRLWRMKGIPRHSCRLMAIAMCQGVRNGKNYGW